MACFLTPLSVGHSHQQPSVLHHQLQTNTCPMLTSPPRRYFPQIQAELKDLQPGVPSGQDARNSTPLRYYVPKPKETYEDRSFTKILPRTWEGEIDTIGAGDAAERERLSGQGQAKTLPGQKEGVVKYEDRFADVDKQSTNAFLKFNDMMREERKKDMERLKKMKMQELDGRATCGPEAGKEKVSNFREDLYLNPTDATEYWRDKTYDRVPRRFGAGEF